MMERDKYEKIWIKRKRGYIHKAGSIDEICKEALAKFKASRNIQYLQTAVEILIRRYGMDKEDAINTIRTYLKEDPELAQALELKIGNVTLKNIEDIYGYRGDFEPLIRACQDGSLENWLRTQLYSDKEIKKIIDYIHEAGSIDEICKKALASKEYLNLTKLFAKASMNPIKFFVKDKAYSLKAWLHARSNAKSEVKSAKKELEKVENIKEEKNKLKKCLETLSKELEGVEEKNLPDVLSESIRQYKASNKELVDSYLKALYEEETPDIESMKAYLKDYEKIRRNYLKNLYERWYWKRELEKYAEEKKKLRERMLNSLYKIVGGRPSSANGRNAENVPRTPQTPQRRREENVPETPPTPPTEPPEGRKRFLSGLLSKLKHYLFEYPVYEKWKSAPPAVVSPS